jgi:hypothetical protein
MRHRRKKERERERERTVERRGEHCDISSLHRAPSGEQRLERLRERASTRAGLLQVSSRTVGGRRRGGSGAARS